MLNGIISARRAGIRGGWKAEVALYKGETLVSIHTTATFTGKGVKDAALKAADAIRPKLEEGRGGE